MTEMRVRWAVTLWGPRAADDPEHSVGGSGDTPEEALKDLRENLDHKLNLVEEFMDTAMKTKP
jgi:hypothetical protein